MNASEQLIFDYMTSERDLFDSCKDLDSIEIKDQYLMLCDVCEYHNDEVSPLAREIVERFAANVDFNKILKAMHNLDKHVKAGTFVF